MNSKIILFALASAFLLMPSQLAAQSKVVVVPLIGNGSDIKPIPVSDVVDRRRAFTFSSDVLFVARTTSEKLFVLKSILVSPEAYPSTRRPISLRFCRNSNRTSCSHSWDVPNDNVTLLDFGVGETFDFEQDIYIDVVNRGGLAQSVAQQIQVHVSGYLVDR